MISKMLLRHREEIHLEITEVILCFRQNKIHFFERRNECLVMRLYLKDLEKIYLGESKVTYPKLDDSESLTFDKIQKIHFCEFSRERNQWFWIGRDTKVTIKDFDMHSIQIFVESNEPIDEIKKFTSH